MLKLAVIGHGYWGPNVLRNFYGQPECQVVAVCDSNPKALERAASRYPGLRASLDSAEVLDAPDVDAVAIVTPVSTHHALARQALEQGKHVFVEKPFTATTAQAEDLIELAERKHLQIMVDHTFLFTGAVRKLKELIDGAVLGRLYYYDSTRVNLGLFQHDINVIWDLAPHDLAIMDYLIGREPEAVQATGGAHLNGLEDLAHITVYFPDRITAHINVNWLSPVKVRTTLLGGERKMVVWNDLEPAEKIKVYDKGVEVGTRQGVYELLISYRSGDMWAPRVDETEALQLEARYFLDCVASGTRPFNDGRAGLRVVRMLEAANESLKRRREILYAGSDGHGAAAPDQVALPGGPNGSGGGNGTVASGPPARAALVP
jgi:predicted dehydrogenase